MTTETTRKLTDARNSARTTVTRPRAGGRSAAPRRVTGEAQAPASPAAPPAFRPPVRPSARPVLSIRVLQQAARLAMETAHDKPTSQDLMMHVTCALSNNTDPRNAYGLALALAAHAETYGLFSDDVPAVRADVAQLVTLAARIMRTVDPGSACYDAAVEAAIARGRAEFGPAPLVARAIDAIDAAATPAHTEADRAAVKAAFGAG